MGTWNITTATPWTGYFSQGSKGLLIARGSPATGLAKRGEYRPFGLAGKIFPTLDPDASVKTANFILTDVTQVPLNHFVDSKFDNDLINANPLVPLNEAVNGAAITIANAAAENTADLVFQSHYTSAISDC